MVVKVVVEGEGGSGVSTRQVKSSVQQLPNISQILFFKKSHLLLLLLLLKIRGGLVTSADVKVAWMLQ